jgi:NADH-quinone oxidoreductase subunit J
MIADTAYTVLFYLLSAAAILMALAVVNARKLLRAAVALMGVLSLSAGLYVMLGAEFLAGVQVLVYVGGIVVLIVFAIMLTRSADLLEDHPAPMRMLLGALVSVGFLILTVTALATTQFPLAAAPTAPANDAQAIGQMLLDYGPEGYVLPFEIISLLLLAAVLGGIVIARKTRPEGQPFTSGGDEPGEFEIERPFVQHEVMRLGIAEAPAPADKAQEPDADEEEGEEILTGEVK